MNSDTLTRAINALVLLITVSLAACGGKEAVAPGDVERQASEDFRQSIMEVIEDPDREAEVLALVEDLQRDFVKFRESVTKRRTELRRLNADYDATREQFKEYIEKYGAGVELARKAVMQRRMALIAATTEEEWDALQKAETKAMKTMVGIVDGI